MKTSLAGAILVLLLLIGGPVFAAETLTLYDNFNASTINYLKWTGGAGEVLENRVYVFFPAAGDGELRMEARGWGFRTSNARPSEGRGSRNRVLFRRLDPNVIRAVRANIRVNSATAVACPVTPASPEVTQARFRIGGYFFNDGTGEPGRPMGDVFAKIEVRRLSNNPTVNQLDVRGTVLRCMDTSDCAITRVLFNQVLGSIMVGEQHAVLVQYWQSGSGHRRSDRRGTRCG
jgi:hypothetical protein